MSESAQAATEPRRIEIRPARLADVPAIRRLGAMAYAEQDNYTVDQIAAQIRWFPDGHLVAEHDGEVVGYCASIRLPESRALAPHTWKSITGNGYGSTHDADGDWLYGYEVMVDRSHRGHRLGQRLYTARRKLCVDLGLKGIVFGGRLPGLARRQAKNPDAEAYVAAVQAGDLRDQVMSFQLRNGFEPIGVLPGYDPTDRASLGYAVHLVWRNDKDQPKSRHAAYAPDRPASTVRIASVQYLQRAIEDWAGFERIVTYFVDTVADNRCDFVLFPEYFTVQLLSIENAALSPLESIRKLAEYAEPVRDLLQRLALRYNINIIGGSHPVLQPDGTLLNVAWICLRDGSVHEQPKIHPTPGERYWWQITGGDTVRAIDTDCGPIGVLICYDSEFPELTRHLVDQGANLLFVPFSTEERYGYLRVRYCSQARCIENQIYVATAGNVGNLPRFFNMDMHYAQSGIYTPCDFPFARDGIAADTTPNVEMIAFADVSLDALVQARKSGTVQNLKDRRHDLYSVRWGQGRAGTTRND